MFQPFSSYFEVLPSALVASRIIIIIIVVVVVVVVKATMTFRNITKPGKKFTPGRSSKRLSPYLSSMSIYAVLVLCQLNSLHYV